MSRDYGSMIKHPPVVASSSMLSTTESSHTQQKENLKEAWIEGFYHFFSSKEEGHFHSPIVFNSSVIAHGRNPVIELPAGLKYNLVLNRLDCRFEV